ncbi:MAG: PepSY-associated TM helix domain-containing protein [Verrucomicrobiales bacterium]|nr:PepSY-associated TM helix domain-containing protein [Verrucomicrobiales bacterium]
MEQTVCEKKTDQSGSRRVKKKWKPVLTKQVILWHWVSSAICLAGMLLFAFTGITLNNPGKFKASPQVKERITTLPEDLHIHLTSPEGKEGDFKAPVGRPLAAWLEKETGDSIARRQAEWSDAEIYLSLPRPGGDGWLAIDRQSGEMTYEVTDRGTISFLNDLHKGRDTGPVWRWFMDIFSGACFVFSLTGLGLLYVHARRRPSTWPLIATGILLPIIIILFFLH